MSSLRFTRIQLLIIIVLVLLISGDFLVVFGQDIPTFEVGKTTTFSDEGDFNYHYTIDNVGPHQPGSPEFTTISVGKYASTHMITSPGEGGMSFAEVGGTFRAVDNLFPNVLTASLSLDITYRLKVDFNINVPPSCAGCGAGAASAYIKVVDETDLTIFYEEISFLHIAPDSADTGVQHIVVDMGKQEIQDGTLTGFKIQMRTHADVYWPDYADALAEVTVNSFTIDQTIPWPVDPDPTNMPPQRNYFTTSTPTLSWTRVSNAVEYEVQVDNAITFSAPLSFSIKVSESSLWVTTHPLPDGLYFWRVRARNAQSPSNWSVVDSFVINSP